MTPRIAKYFTEVTGIHIHTNFSMMEHEDEESNRMVFRELEEIPGVDRINLSRYKVQINFGFLFNTSECADNIINAMVSLFNIDDISRFTTQDLMEKAKQTPLPSKREATKQEEERAIEALKVFGTGDFGEA